MNFILSCKNVKKYFGGLAALDGVDINIQEGLFNLIIGPNGSGKTTLINVIAGFYSVDEGNIIYDGKDITKLQSHERFKLGLVRTFQIPVPFLKLTVLENLLTAARDNPGEKFIYAPIKRIWKNKEEEAYETALRILSIVNLYHMKDSPSYKLSGGQLKLLEIARVLMCNAKFIMMDEPAAGINPALAHELFSYLKNLVKELKITLLVIEHRLDLALPYADYAYAMANGKIISEGKPEEVLNDQKVIESYLGK
jgi:branched-chain amino acid transport system ATP-binding protein